MIRDRLWRALDDALRHAGVRVVIRIEQIIVVVCRRALAEGPHFRSFERCRRQGLVDKRDRQRELVLEVQMNVPRLISARRQMSTTVIFAETDLGQRKNASPYDRERMASATIGFPDSMAPRCGAPAIASSRSVYQQQLEAVHCSGANQH